MCLFLTSMHIYECMLGEQQQHQCFLKTIEVENQCFSQVEQRLVVRPTNSVAGPAKKRLKIEVVMSFLLYQYLAILR